MLRESDIKLIAFDLDGTLLNSKKEISKYTEKVLNEIPCKKAVVTSRTYENVSDVIKNILVDYIVCSNGSEIYVKDTLVLKQYLTKEESIGIVNKVLSLFPDTSIKVKGSKNLLIKNSKDIKGINNIEKITIKINNSTDMTKITEELGKYNTSFVDNKYLIITNKRASKYIGLTKILNYDDKISLNEVIYFGDDLNDLEVFKKVPISVAVKNANNKVINESTFICDTNDNDGVAKFLNKCFFEKKSSHLNKFKGGSVCHVKYDKRNKCIQKDVEINNEGINNGYSKLFYEAKHMQQYNSANNVKLYPEIYEIKGSGNKLVVKMEYLFNGVTLTDLLFNNLVGRKYIKNSLSNIIDKLFNELYLKKKNIIPNKDYLNINYFDRLSSRIEETKKILRKRNDYVKLKSALIDGIYIDNVFYPSVSEYNDFLRKNFIALNKLSILNCTESHQDLIPSNIIVDFDLDKQSINGFKLVDPRGEGDTGQDNRHFTYDMGKLLFGLSGFEIFRRKNKKDYYSLECDKKTDVYNYRFNIKQDISINKLNYAREILLKKLEKNKYEYFESINLVETYKEKILFAEAYCFFADIPCRLIDKEDEDTLLCFYIRGMQCLTKFMEMIYGEDVVRKS